MTGSSHTGLDEFFNVLRDVRKIALAAAGGLILLPIIAGLGGYTPPWPIGIAIVTSLMEVVVLIVVFQLLSRAPRAIASKTIVWSAILVFIMSAVYMTLNAIFVYQIPSNATRVILGCGLSEKAGIILAHSGLKPTDVCPGEFSSLLASAQYESDKIWTKQSVDFIKVALVVSWLMAFGGLAALFGVFTSFQRRQRSKAKAPRG